MHDHDHHHPVEIKNVNSAFIIGIALNFLFVIIEVVAGLRIHSLSLLSDAGHNLADVAALALSLLAFKMLKVKPSKKYTYGYKKTTILVALLNAVVLLVSIGAIVYEAIQRFIHPQPLPGKIISIIAAIGIVINAITAYMFFKNKENDLNIKSAFLHLLSDAVVSAGIVIGGVIIFYTDYFWIDPVISIVIAIVILVSTWSILRKSLRLSLDAVPEGIDLNKVKNIIKKREDVIDFHHIHIWAMSTTQNALTAHLVVANNTSHQKLAEIKSAIKHELEHLNIHHTTLETEFENSNCEEKEC